MSKIFRRVRGVLDRSRRLQRSSSSPTVNPYSKQTLGPNKKLPEEFDEDDIDDEMENISDDDPSQQTDIRSQTRGARPVNEGRPFTSSNLGNPSLRSGSNRIQSDPPHNNNNNNTSTTINPTVNLNAGRISNPPTQADLPIRSQRDDRSSPSPINPVLPPSLDGLPSGISPNQPSIHLRNDIPRANSRSNLTLLMNRGRQPLKISPNSTLIGFPPNPNKPTRLASPWQARSAFPQHPQRARSLFRPQDNFSNREYEYPIRDILIDGNIPSSMAMKINQAVEQDRFGNTQRIRSQPMGNSARNGLRHIREIHNQNSYSPQLIINEPSQVTCSYQYDLDYFPTPIHHYVACSLPNDPMRNY